MPTLKLLCTIMDGSKEVFPRRYAAFQVSNREPQRSPDGDWLVSVKVAEDIHFGSSTAPFVADCLRVWMGDAEMEAPCGRLKVSAGTEFNVMKNV